MILRCNFEELGALRDGARTFLSESSRSRSPVAAPPEGREEVEALLSRLDGDLIIETLAEQRLVLRAVAVILERLKEEMDRAILSTHAADEISVASYFSYAHSLSVFARLSAMGQEMEAVIEVVTGEPPTPGIAATFFFPN
jgi:hypothetical protein